MKFPNDRPDPEIRRFVSGWSAECRRHESELRGLLWGLRDFTTGLASVIASVARAVHAVERAEIALCNYEFCRAVDHLSEARDRLAESGRSVEHMPGRSHRFEVKWKALDSLRIRVQENTLRRKAVSP